MADTTLDKVILLVRGSQFSVSQLGIDLIQQSEVTNDPVVEAVVVMRRKSGLLETEVSVNHKDTLSRMAEHLMMTSHIEAYKDNERCAKEEEDNDT